MGKTPLNLALQRGDGSRSRYDTFVISPAKGHLDATQIYVERIVKFLLWQRGGWKLHVGGPAEIGNHIKSVYSANGARRFDVDFMATVYEHPFEVIVTGAESVPAAAESSIPLGRHLNGCRVGFDLGASDRKASAVKDGEAVFSEEVVWDPKTARDPEYHYQGVLDSSGAPQRICHVWMQSVAAPPEFISTTGCGSDRSIAEFPRKISRKKLLPYSCAFATNWVFRWRSSTMARSRRWPGRCPSAKILSSELHSVPAKPPAM